NQLLGVGLGARVSLKLREQPYQRVQRVFDLASHVCRQFARRSQAFGPPQRFPELRIEFFDLLLRVLALSDVADGAGDEKSLRGPQRAETDFNGKLQPILAFAEKLLPGAHRTNVRLGEK